MVTIPLKPQYQYHYVLCFTVLPTAVAGKHILHTCRRIHWTFSFLFFFKVLLFCIIHLSLDLISVLAKWTKQQHTHASCHQVPHIIGLLDLPLELILFALLLSFVFSLSLTLLSLVLPLHFSNQPFLSSLIALTPQSNPSLSLIRSMYTDPCR